MRPLEFGWYLPTHGDTTAYGLAEAQVAGSPELCERVVKAAEQAGFEYLLIPVGSTCWEAWIAGAFMAARSVRIKPLIAARPGYINPVLMAKMISTFDQMSGGRISINLIAGQNEREVEAEGVRYAKEERYALMEEEVSILKALWTTRGPVHFQGKFHTLSGAHIRPRPQQQPFPKFYLGGGSRQAWEVSAKHSDVHLCISRASSIRCRARISGRGHSSSRFRNSISAAARGRPGRCRRNIPTCICAYPGQVPYAVGRAYPAAATAAAVSEILSRRRLAAGLGGVGETFRRASVLGRSAGADRREHRRDQGAGTRA